MLYDSDTRLRHVIYRNSCMRRNTMRRVDQCYELLLYIQGVHSYVIQGR
jgi:hypothetical protein